jgi:hypothetical protein
LTTVTICFHDFNSLRSFVQQILDAQTLAEPALQRRKLDLLPPEKVFLRLEADPPPLSPYVSYDVGDEPLICTLQVVVSGGESVPESLGTAHGG